MLFSLLSPIPQLLSTCPQSPFPHCAWQCRVSHLQAYLESIAPCKNTVLPSHLLFPPASPSLQYPCECSPEPPSTPPALFSWPALRTSAGNQDKPVSLRGNCIWTGLKAWAPSVAAFRNLFNTSLPDKFFFFLFIGWNEKTLF